MLVLVGAAVLVLGAGALYQVIGSRTDAARFAPPGVMIDVGRQRLHVVCAGNGNPAVVFESGIAASSLNWTPVVREVGAFTRACAYDRAGLGWSAVAATPRNLTQMLRELDGVRANAAAGGAAVLVGHSFGAFLVCAYASQQPKDVAGLVLLDPPSEWHEITREQAHLLWGGVQLSRIGGLLARLGVVRACLALPTGGAPGVPRNFVRIFGPTAARTLERIVGEVRKMPAEAYPIIQMQWCQPKCFRGLREHLGALEETAACVGRIAALPDVPLVVISSGDQPSNVLDKHRQLATLSHEGRHIIATNAGHWVHLDDPELVVATIGTIVDRIHSGSSWNVRS
jgi:pimeloyl-ACP methyl ester carboxylesterase